MSDVNMQTQQDAALTAEKIQAWRRQRLDDAAREIQEVLRRHDCQLIAVPALTEDGRITASVQMRPN